MTLPLVDDALVLSHRAAKRRVRLDQPLAVITEWEPGPYPVDEVATQADPSGTTVLGEGVLGEGVLGEGELGEGELEAGVLEAGVLEAGVLGKGERGETEATVTRLRQATTVLLAGKECPFRCVMCDLWQHTVDGPTPPRALVQQLDEALRQIQHRDTIKLYNASNFFDPLSVPESDYAAIADRVSDFELVVVENHPKLIGRRTFDFANRLSGRLQVAMGLESSDPQVLLHLNKRMTIEDYQAACRHLLEQKIQIRTFLMIQAPGVSPEQAVEQASASVRFAIEAGSQVVSLIPTRAGNGLMDRWLAAGHIALPTLDTIEQSLRASIQCAQLEKRTLLLDLWDLEKFSQCPACFAARHQRLSLFNQTQTLGPEIDCPNCHP